MRLPEVFEIESLPTPEYETIPAGYYAAIIAAAEPRASKNGNGYYLSVQYTILGPTHQGRSVFGNITLSHQNETAMHIGRTQLSELMRAVNVPRLADTEQLIGRQLRIKVVVRANEKYGESNDVRGWKPLGDGQQASSPALPVSPAVPPAHLAPSLAHAQSSAQLPAPAPAINSAETPRPRNTPPWATK